MKRIWQQYKGYLSILLLLVLARFVWQPLWQTKQDSWQQLQYSETAKHKAEKLLGLQAEMQSAEQEMLAILSDAEQKLGRADDITQFKLQTQQRLESVFRQHNLSISLSSWREGVIDNGVQVLVLDLRFSGRVKDYLYLLQQLQQDNELPSMVITEQQLSNNAQSVNSMGETQGRISLRFAAAVQVVS